jgi:hypothetical protein
MSKIKTNPTKSSCFVESLDRGLNRPVWQITVDSWAIRAIAQGVGDKYPRLRHPATAFSCVPRLYSIWYPQFLCWAQYSAHREGSVKADERRRQSYSTTYQ